MFVKPKKGLIVIDPANGQSLPKSGREVPENQYWLRAVMSGDVIEGEDEPPQKNMTLEEAVEYCLEKGDATHLGGDGKPSCNVLKELTGKRVLVADRDAVLDNLKGEEQ